MQKRNNYSLSLSLDKPPISGLEKQKKNKFNTNAGFTIVELLVVIVVIGILAAITIISYSGISQKAIVAALQSDLDNASKKLKMYYTLYGSYPTALDASNCPTVPTADTNYCLPISGSNTINYNGNASSFSLVETNGTTYYKTTNNSSPTAATNLDYGLVGYYTFNGNAIDSSGNGLSGTVNGATLTTGQGGAANTAYSFNGTNNTITMPPAGSDIQSISFWLKKTVGWAAGEFLFNETVSSGTGLSLFRQGTNDLNSYFVSGANAYRIKDFSNNWFTLDGTWHHYVLSFNKSTFQTTIYRDGTVYNTINSDFNTPSGTRTGFNIGGNGVYFNGSLDDLRLYTRALTFGEDQALYAAGAP